VIAQLSGVRVLEVGETVSAAAAGAMLAKFGAEVTRITTSEESAYPGPARPGSQRARLLEILGRGKVDVKFDDVFGESAFSSTGPVDITIVDVSTSGYWGRPGWLGRYEDTVGRCNTSTWVTISPFGLHGPLRGYRGTELTTTAAGGIAYYMRTSLGRPMKPAGFSASIAAGHFAALAGMHGMLLGRYGHAPAHLDLSIQDSVLVTGVFLECSHILFECAKEGASRAYAAPVGLIRCEDGFVWIVVLEEHHWAGCVRALGSPPWATAITSSAARHEQSDAIRHRLNEWAAAYSVRECVRRLQAEGVPATPMSSCADLLSGIGLDVSDGFFVGDGGSAERLPGVPVRSPARAADRPRAGAALDGAPRRHRVLDVSQVLVAPLATSWLGTMGVDVLKVEDPARTDVYRRVGPFLERRPDPEASAYFAFANYSKRSYAVGLDEPGGPERLKELMASADAVVANLSRHRAEQLGVTSAALDATGGPALVSSSGFGATTAYADYRAYGLNIQAAGGAVHLSRDRTGQPQNFGTSWADPLTSIWIAMATLTQLLVPAAERRHVDVSMVEVVACQFPEYFSQSSLTGVDQVADESHLDHASPHAIYRCAGDEAWLAISVETDDEWRGLLDTLGRPPVLGDARFATLAGRRRYEDELDRAIEGVLEGVDRDELFAALQRAGVACAPAWGARELIALPHLHERGLLQSVQHPVWGERPLVGLPWRLVGQGAVPITATPLLGEHTSDDPTLWWK
jgi:crotonobetainyl-CoA:carnitine CoA-transferase CaiB-like acyl-CoA transferase